MKTVIGFILIAPAIVVVLAFTFHLIYETLEGESLWFISLVATVVSLFVGGLLLMGVI